MTGLCEHCGNYWFADAKSGQVRACCPEKEVELLDEIEREMDLRRGRWEDRDDQ